MRDRDDALVPLWRPCRVRDHDRRRRGAEPRPRRGRETPGVRAGGVGLSAILAADRQAPQSSWRSTRQAPRRQWRTELGATHAVDLEAATAIADLTRAGADDAIESSAPRSVAAAVRRRSPRGHAGVRRHPARGRGGQLPGAGLVREEEDRHRLPLRYPAGRTPTCRCCSTSSSTAGSCSTGGGRHYPLDEIDRASPTCARAAASYADRFDVASPLRDRVSRVDGRTPSIPWMDASARRGPGTRPTAAM